MSTTTEKPPTEPLKPDHHDEFTGAFGFFRKYQKLILYTAGIFALITFSISSAMTQWLHGLTSGPTGPRPSIQILGRHVDLEVEDQLVGGQLARNFRSLPETVLPQFLLGGDSEGLATRFAILRRAAITAGIDASMIEVDRAIDFQVRASNARTNTKDTPTSFALQRNMNSLAEYRALVMEGMRIGAYALLNSLGLDSSDAAVMQKLLGEDGHEKLTLRVATFDMKALEKQLKEKGGVSEDDFKAWMNGKTDPEKARLEVFDSNRVALTLGVCKFDGGFDPEQWKDELAEFKWGEEQQKLLYNQEKDRWKDDKGKPKPIDDADVAAKLKQLAQVTEVMNKVLQKLRDAQTETLQAPNKRVVELNQQKFERQQLSDAAKKAAEAAPDDQELARKAREEQEAFTALEQQAKEATDAVNQARKAFPFRDKFTEFTKDKQGFELVDVPGGKRNAKALRDLAEIGLGEWKKPELATALGTAGDLGSMPAQAQNGVFLLQVQDVDVRPLKPWDEIKAHVEDKYFEEQARKVGDDNKKRLEEQLLRLAKEKIPEKVTELEGKQTPEIDRQYAEWEKKIGEDMAKADEMLGKVAAGTQARAAWQRKRDQLDTELKGKEQHRASIEKDVKAKTETEVKAEAKKKYGEVIEEAAGLSGFTLANVGPYRRDVRMEPLFNKRYDRTVVFLWGGLVNEFEAGDCTEISEDTMERRFQLAVCQTVEPLTAADVARREFESRKRNFDLFQVITALQQSFTLEALKERYSYDEPEGRQRVAGGDTKPPK